MKILNQLIFHLNKILMFTEINWAIFKYLLIHFYEKVYRLQALDNSNLIYVVDI